MVFRLLTPTFSGWLSRAHSRTTLESLPNEVLLLVFSFLSDESIQSLLDMTQISLVCRRVRGLITSTASFWTTISKNHAKDGVGTVEAYLARSMDLSLSVVVDHDYPEERHRYDTFSFLHTTLQHAHRWKELAFNFCDTEGRRGVSWKDLREIKELLAIQKLPILETLELHTPYRVSTSMHPALLDTDDDSDNEDDLDDVSGIRNRYHIYTSMDVSNLKRLVMSQTVPRVHPAMRLTSCRLSYRRPYGSAPSPNMSFHGLTAFLASQQTLQCLEMDPSYFPIRRNESTHSGVVRLPALVELKIQTSQISLYSTHRIVPLLMNSLDIPNVKSLTLLFPAHSLTVEYPIAPMFPNSRTYERLEFISIHIRRHLVHRTSVHLYDTLLGRFPNLQVLKLGLANANALPTLPASWVPRPPLRRLHIFGDESLEKFELDKALQFLKDGEHWDRLEALVISETCWRSSNCSLPTVGVFDDFPRDKVVVEKDDAIGPERLSKWFELD
jgi:hypothetical protein